MSVIIYIRSFLTTYKDLSEGSISFLYECGLTLAWLLFVSPPPLPSADLPPTGPMDLSLSLLEMGCSGRFELITHPLPDQPVPPQSTVSISIHLGCVQFYMVCFFSTKMATALAKHSLYNMLYPPCIVFNYYKWKLSYNSRCCEHWSLLQCYNGSTRSPKYRYLTENVVKDMAFNI